MMKEAPLAKRISTVCLGDKVFHRGGKGQEHQVLFPNPEQCLLYRINLHTVVNGNRVAHPYDSCAQDLVLKNFPRDLPEAGSLIADHTDDLKSYLRNRDQFFDHFIELLRRWPGMMIGSSLSGGNNKGFDGRLPGCEIKTYTIGETPAYFYLPDRDFFVLQDILHHFRRAPADVEPQIGL